MNDVEIEILDRITRIETRLAQLMKFVGANVYEPNRQGELIDEIEARLCGNGYCPECVPQRTEAP